MPFATRGLYRRLLEQKVWHFDHACPQWPKSRFLQFETPNRPELVCPVCELQEWSYDTTEASALFLGAGKRLDVAGGHRVFSENERTTRLLARGEPIYLVLSGIVDLFVGKRRIGSVHPGEIFGEIELISGTPRCATAIARCSSQVVMLEAHQFHKALKTRPGFALSLMSVLVNRVRKAAAAGTLQSDYSDEYVATTNNFLGRKLMDQLLDQHGETSRSYMQANSVIMSEGDTAVFMYVVLEGRVDILIGGRLVETIGPGGVFGEMAVFDQARRSGTAIAQSDCSLLAISRRDFVALLESQPAFVSALTRALAERLRLMTKSNQAQAA